MSRSVRGGRSIVIAGVVLVAASLAACGDDGSASSSVQGGSVGTFTGSSAAGVFPISRGPTVPSSSSFQGKTGTPSVPSTTPLRTPQNPGGGLKNPGGGSLTALTVAWQAPTQNNDGTPLTDLRGYRVYYGHASHNYSDTIQVSNPGVTDYVVQNLQPGQYYFAVSAYNSAGEESTLSSEASTSVN